jgi:hypothetical protein
MEKFNAETATKKELQAELTRQGVGFPPKANVATLRGLLAGHTDDDADAPADAVADAPAAAPEGSGLKIEKDRPEQNGIKRPSIGGKCRAVWDACDEMVAAGTPPTAKDVRAIAEANGWNANNASIEFYQWRKFNGITGRQPKVEAPAAATKEETPAS